MATLLQTFAGRELSLSPFHFLKASLEELLEGEQPNQDMLVKFKRHIWFQEMLCWVLERLAHAADDGEALALWSLQSGSCAATGLKASKRASGWVPCCERASRPRFCI